METLKEGTFKVSKYYTGEHCSNCNRVRVLTITLNSGEEKHICEKCNWCEEDSDYAISEDELGYFQLLFG